MTETVSSEFRKSLWSAPICLGIFIFIMIAVCVNLSDDEYSRGNAQVIMISLAILTVLICGNTYRAVKRFIKVSVGPDALLLHYLLINEKTIINYADITHVSVVRKNTDSYNIYTTINLIDTIKLKIELNSGKKIYLFEEYYKNFDELKEAIRRARFKLD
jgi:hypothetical protein